MYIKRNFWRLGVDCKSTKGSSSTVSGISSLSCVLLIAALLPTSVWAGKDASDFDTLPFIGPITGNTIFISPFEIDALSCYSIPGQLDPNCDVNGQGLQDGTVSGSLNSGWDFTVVSTLAIDPKFPYPSDILSGPPTNNVPLRFTGIAPVGNFEQIIDGGNGGNCASTPEYAGTPKLDESNYETTSANQNSNPYPAPQVGTPNNKTDVCTFYSALETVRVIDHTGIPTPQPADLIDAGFPPPYEYDQNHNILYLGLRTNPAGSGNRFFLLPLYQNIFDSDDCTSFDPANPADALPDGCENDGLPIRPDGVYALGWDMDPDTGPSFTLTQWEDPDQDGTGVWIDRETDITQGATIDCEYTCLATGGGVIPCAGNGTLNYAECAIDVTGLITDSDTSPLICTSGSLPNLLSRVGNSKTSQLTDIVQRPPLPNSNCGEVEVTKIFHTNLDTPRDFDWEMFQVDAKEVHDDTLRGMFTEPPPPGPWVDGDIIVPLNLYNPPINLTEDEKALTDEFEIDPASYNTRRKLYDGIIAEPDYLLMEKLPIDGSSGGTTMWLQSIKCDYYDIMTATRITDHVVWEAAALAPDTPDQPNVPPLIDLVGINKLFDGEFSTAPFPYMGMDTEADRINLRTNCTIINADDTVPVVLGHFHATRSGDLTNFEWSTVAEVGHMGFNLKMQDENGKWVVVNTEGVIPPAADGDSFELREYSYEATGLAGDTFFLTDIGALGGERKNGPFKLGQSYGIESEPAPATAWRAIGEEHRVKKAKRAKRDKLKFKSNLKRHKEKTGKKRSDDLSMQEQPGRESIWQRVAEVLTSLLMNSAHAADVQAPIENPGALFLDVTAEGVHRVTYEDLAAEGFDAIAGVDPSTIGLANNGVTVPMHVHTEGEGTVVKVKGRQVVIPATFGPGSYLEFIAEKINSRYTDDNTYALYMDGSHIERLGDDATLPESATPVISYLQTDTFEGDVAHPETFYSTATPMDDPWSCLDLYSNGGGVEKFLSLPIDNYNGGQATIEVDVWGYGFNLQHLQIDVNAAANVAGGVFSGLTSHTYTGDLAAGGLHNGSNTVNFVIPAGSAMERIVINRVRLTYPRDLVARVGRLSFSAAGEVFEVSGFTGSDIAVYREFDDGVIERLSGVEAVNDGANFKARFAGTANASTYHVAAVNAMPAVSYRVPATDAAILDSKRKSAAAYMIISHPDFIYDEDGQMNSDMSRLLEANKAQFGSAAVVSTEAIYAHFGGGIFGAQPIADFIHWAAENRQSETFLLVGSDVYDYLDRLGIGAISFLPSLYMRTGVYNSHAPVDPKYVDFDDDNVPDRAIGRLIPRTSEEWHVMVEKTLAYTSDSQRSVFSADVPDATSGHSFKNDSEALITEIPVAWQSGVTRVYVEDDPDARTTLIDALNASPALVSYAGHSATKRWAPGLLTANDAAALLNESPFVVNQWGCWNTYYVSPLSDSMAHMFLRNGVDSGMNSGAVAVSGPTGLTSISNEISLGTGLFREMFNGGTLGEAVLSAKRSLAETNPGALDVLMGWTLIGDPGLVISP